MPVFDAGKKALLQLLRENVGQQALFRGRGVYPEIPMIFY